MATADPRSAADPPTVLSLANTLRSVFSRKTLADTAHVLVYLYYKSTVRRLLQLDTTIQTVGSYQAPNFTEDVTTIHSTYKLDRYLIRLRKWSKILNDMYTSRANSIKNPTNKTPNNDIVVALIKQFADEAAEMLVHYESIHLILLDALRIWYNDTDQTPACIPNLHYCLSISTPVDLIDEYYYKEYDAQDFIHMLLNIKENIIYIEKANYMATMIKVIKRGYKESMASNKSTSLLPLFSVSFLWPAMVSNYVDASLAELIQIFSKHSRPVAMQMLFNSYMEFLNPPASTDVAMGLLFHYLSQLATDHPWASFALRRLQQCHKQSAEFSVDIFWVFAKHVHSFTEDDGGYTTDVDYEAVNTDMLNYLQDRDIRRNQFNRTDDTGLGNIAAFDNFVNLPVMKIYLRSDKLLHEILFTHLGFVPCYIHNSYNTKSSIAGRWANVTKHLNITMTDQLTEAEQQFRKSYAYINFSQLFKDDQSGRMAEDMPRLLTLAHLHGVQPDPENLLLRTALASDLYSDKIFYLHCMLYNKNVDVVRTVVTGNVTTVLVRETPYVEK